MRLFIAITLDEVMRHALEQVQAQLRRRGVEGNYTPRENLHLTLAFIGEYPDPDTVLEAIESLRFSAFPLALEGSGSFDRLYWCGLGGSQALETTAQRLRRCLAEAEIPFDRKRFRPHITLLRKAVCPGGKFPGVAVPRASMTVSAVSLMRSERGKRGMIYTELGQIAAEG